MKVHILGNFRVVMVAAAEGVVLMPWDSSAPIEACVEGLTLQLRDTADGRVQGYYEMELR